MKPKGYILFSYYSGCKGFSPGTTISGEIYDSLDELSKAWHNDWDDKWDCEGRNKIDYFYLDLATGEYHAMLKWKDDYDRTKGYEQSERTVLSKKVFKV